MPAGSPSAYQPHAYQPHAAASPRSLSGTLGGWLQGLYWTSAGLLLIGAVLFFATAIEFQTAWADPSQRVRDDAFDAFVDLEDAAITTYGFVILVWIAVFVLMIVWMNKAHKVTSELWRGHRTWSSGWTIGGWFIPLANFVIPKLVLGEIERIATTADQHGRVGPDWRRTSTSVVGWIYWVGIVVGLVAFHVGAGIVPDEEFFLSESDADLAVASYVLRGAGMVVWGVGAVFGALHVRRIGRRLSADAVRRYDQQPPSPLTTSLMPPPPSWS